MDIDEMFERRQILLDFRFGPATQQYGRPDLFAMLVEAQIVVEEVVRRLNDSLMVLLGYSPGAGIVIADFACCGAASVRPVRQHLLDSRKEDPLAELGQMFNHVRDRIESCPRWAGHRRRSVPCGAGRPSGCRGPPSQWVNNHRSIFDRSSVDGLQGLINGLLHCHEFVASTVSLGGVK